MAKLNYSDFESIKDIINEIKVNYEQNNVQLIEKLGIIWKEAVGNNVSLLSKVYSLSEDNILTIVCSDSHVSNELYFVKSKLIKTINEKLKDENAEIKDIIFNYKKWEKSYDKE